MAVMSNKQAEETNNSESFISDQAKDPDIVVNTKKKLRRKESKRKRKIVLTLIFQETIEKDVSTIK